MEYRYHIRQFIWDKKQNEFFAEAPFLECVLPDGEFHPEAFPNMKGEFYIDNPKTGGFRRFRFVKENKIMDGENYLYTEWIFESEDGIKCKIAID
jgi:hypothetical protein